MSGSPSATPISLGERVQHPDVGHARRCRAAPRRTGGRGPPSRGTCRPSRPRPRRAGPRRRARSRPLAQLEADQERRRVERGQRGRRVGQVVGVDAADHQRAAARRCATAARIAAVSRPARVRQAVDAPGRADVDPRRRRRRPVGRRAAGPAGRRPRARRARRRGAAPRPAGHRSPRRVARPRSARRAPTPGRSPTRMTAPPARSRARRRRRRPTAPAYASASSTPGSAPGAVGRTWPDSFSRPRPANGATRVDGEPAAAYGLAQPQEDDRRLLLGLEPDEQHGRRLLEVGVGHAEPATGDVRGEEGLLLGRVRPGPEVDVVGAERDAGELGVARRRPRPSARPPTSTPVAPRAAARPRAAMSSASAQDVGTSCAVVVADQRSA